MDKKLIQKFKAGKCTNEEIRKILRWYQSEQAEAYYSVEIENLWNLEEEIPLSDKEELFKSIQERIHQQEKTGKKEPFYQRDPLPGNGNSSSVRKLAIGVALLLFLTASGLLLFFQPQLFKQPQSAPEIRMLSKVINRGQKYTMNLSDGTKVKLNSKSKFHYPEIFSDSLRVIEFEGEAFFEVAKDSTRPFIIRTGNISTTVLGTSFNMKTKTTLGNFEVAVVTGSVKVAHVNQGHSLDERYLAPNQQAVFDSENKTFKVQNFDQEKVLAWVNGTIMFENSSLEEITRKLEDWYGVEIDTTGLNRRILKGYTGNYKDKSLESVLDGISYVLDFEYEILDKKVIIK